MRISQALTPLALGWATVLHAQGPAAEQSTGFNSSITLTPDQIAAAELSPAQAESLANIINFDRSQLANGGPAEDAFYALPPLFGNVTEDNITPGTLLRAENVTDLSPFAIPPNTALSRLLYTTTNFNGTAVPTSAFVLWPFTPRPIPQPDSTESPSSVAKAPVVLWTHGTAGFFPSNAPSSHRALWYGHSAPFALAQAGYAVVAADFAGLGVGHSWNGTPIAHQYLVSPASARDALNSLRAARLAFGDMLTKEFVVMGHSQGGGVAWAVAEALSGDNATTDFADLVGGYRGAIAGSPTTTALGGAPLLTPPWVSIGLSSIFPSFNMSDWLTPLGVARTALFQELEGGIMAGFQLFGNPADELVRPEWNTTWYHDAYEKLANAGRKKFLGPLLVLTGNQDFYVSYNFTAAAVQDTCKVFPDGDLELAVANGTGHVPSLDATRQLWMGWIEDRFAGRALQRKGCVRTDLPSFLPIEQYVKAGNSFLQWAGSPEYSYEAPLGP